MDPLRQEFAEHTIEHVTARGSLHLVGKGVVSGFNSELTDERATLK
jgi:hypothetical protein